MIAAMAKALEDAAALYPVESEKSAKPLRPVVE